MMMKPIIDIKERSAVMCERHVIRGLPVRKDHTYENLHAYSMECHMRNIVTR